MADTYYPPLERKPAYKPAWDRGHIVQGVEDRKNAEAQKVGFGEAAKKAFLYGDNFAVQIAKDIERIASSGPEDPEWNKTKHDWLKLNRNRIDESDDWRYLQTRNSVEAEATLTDAEQNAREQDILARRGGVSTFVARGLAGILDIDTPIALATGGLTAGAKLGINATKMGRLMSGAAVGGITATGAAAVGTDADPNGDWSLIPLAGLLGMGFGGLGGAMARAPNTPANLANAARRNAVEEFSETIQVGQPRAKEDLRNEVFSNDDPYHSERFERDIAIAAEEALEADKAAQAASATPEAKRKPVALDVDEIERAAITDVELPQEGRSSIGARQLGNSGPGIASIRSTRVQDMITSARTRVSQLGIHTDWLDGFATAKQKAGPVGVYAERFHNTLSNSPLATDFSRMMNSGSAVAQGVAYDLLENATGIIRNGRSAARLMDHYQKGMLNTFQPFHDAYSEWAAAAKNSGWLQRAWNTQHKDEFNRLVTEELQARFHNGHSVTKSPAIKKAADAIDQMFDMEVDISVGRPGETAIKGAQNLAKKSGYMPQKWLGHNMRKLIDSGRFKRKDLIDAIAEGYRHQFPSISAKDSQIYADAVVGRAEKFDQGINTNLIGVLQGDGRAEMFDVLRRQGMSEQEVNKFINRLTQTMEERGAPGHTKQRMDIDLRYVASNGVRIMDLVDTDFASMVPRRVRKSAGLAALARKGIASRQDWDDIKTAISEEQVANGPSLPSGAGRVADFIDKDKHVDNEFLDNLYTYFNGDPIAGGISPMYSRIKKLTNLALLNQLGLTQLAELGVTMSAAGIEQFFRHANEALRGEIKKVDSPLVQELKHMNIFVPEEKLFRDDLVHEFEKQTATSEYMRNFDRLLNKMQRVQGFTSGFYAIRRIQQRIAVTAAADKIMRGFKTKEWSPERLIDIGIDPKFAAKLKSYVDNGTVQFDADGNLVKLNMHNWDVEDAETFALSLNASTNTLVQKAMAGESNMLFHKDGVASLFWHLKSFPMLAMEKQLLRSIRLMDTEAAMTFLYGLGTAATAYSLKQVINGREENLSFEKIAKGAFGYSNMTGWIPMWTDPLAGMLGMDALKVGGYGRATSVISTPAAIGTIDRMIQAPAAAAKAVLPFADLDSGDINALMATPLIGNAFGFAYIFNAMKQ